MLLTAGVMYAQNVDKLIKDFKNKKGVEYVKTDDLEHKNSATLDGLLGFANISLEGGDGSAMMNREDSLEMVKQIMGSLGIRAFEILNLEKCSDKVKNDFCKKTKGFSPDGYELMVAGRDRESTHDSRAYTRGEGEDMELLVIGRDSEGLGVMRLTGSLLPFHLDGHNNLSGEIQQQDTLFQLNGDSDGDSDGDFDGDSDAVVETDTFYLGNLKNLADGLHTTILSQVPDYLLDKIAALVSNYKDKEGALYEMQTSASNPQLTTDFVKYYGGEESEVKNMAIESWERLSLDSSSYGQSFALMMKSLGDVSRGVEVSYSSGERYSTLYILKKDKDETIEDLMLLANNPDKKITHYARVKGKIDIGFAKSKMALHEVTF